MTMTPFMTAADALIASRTRRRISAKFPLHPAGGGIDMPAPAEGAGHAFHVDVPLGAQAQFETPVRQLRIEDGNLDPPDGPGQIDKPFGMLRQRPGIGKRLLRHDQRSDAALLRRWSAWEERPRAGGSWPADSSHRHFPRSTGDRRRRPPGPPRPGGCPGRCSRSGNRPYRSGWPYRGRSPSPGSPPGPYAPTSRQISSPVELACGSISAASQNPPLET